MSLPLARRWVRHASPLGALVPACVAVALGAAPADALAAGASPDLSRPALWGLAAVFAAAQAALAYRTIRASRPEGVERPDGDRPSAGTSRPARPGRGELAWSTVPALLVALLFAATFEALDGRRDPEPARADRASPVTATAEPPASPGRLGSRAREGAGEADRPGSAATAEVDLAGRTPGRRAAGPAAERSPSDIFE